MYLQKISGNVKKDLKNDSGCGMMCKYCIDPRIKKEKRMLL